VEPDIDGTSTLTREQYNRVRNGSKPPKAEQQRAAARQPRKRGMRALAEHLSAIPAKVSAIELVGWRCQRVAD
jgi:hypothetical protein